MASKKVHSKKVRRHLWQGLVFAGLALAFTITTFSGAWAEAEPKDATEVTKKANAMYNTGYAVVAYPGVAKAVEHFPANLTEKMIDNDFEFAANNRAAILKGWQGRYDAKSDPK